VFYTLNPLVGLIFCLLLAGPVWAQKEGNIWYFGEEGQGMDFNRQPPALLTDGKLSSPNGGGYVSVSVMADPCGQLLFYSNGQTVWNASHQVMDNGKDLYGLTSRSVMALPYPGRDSLYLLITSLSDPKDTIPDGIYYSVIDMRPEGGKGRVVQKNQLVARDPSRMGLGINAVKHANERNFWVLTVGFQPPGVTANRIWAFLVDENGIRTSPVETPIGREMASTNLRASPDGKKLLNSTNDPLSFAQITISLFDPSSGRVTKTIALPNPTRVSGFWLGEFSPDSKNIYVQWLESTNNPQTVFAQYRLVSEDPNEILKTEYRYPSDLVRTLGDMRLAPDGKIYLTHTPRTAKQLDVIQNPNAAGAASQYQKGAFPLQGASGLFLPDNIAGFVLGKQTRFQADAPCLGQEVRFSPQTNYPVKQHYWDFDDPASGVANQSTQATPRHRFSAEGTYRVRLVTLNRCEEYDTVWNQVTLYPDPIVNFDTDTLTVCYTEAPVSLSVRNYPNTTYQWNTQQAASRIEAGKSGWYTVTATNACATRSDSIYVEIIPPVEARLANDTVVCKGRPALLDAGNPGATYRWSTGHTDRVMETDEPGLYWVEITNACSSVVDTVQVVYVPQEVSARTHNVFTPNGDGWNDRFVNYVINAPDFAMRIVNRWGRTVFETRQATDYWDGTWQGEVLPNGVYFWSIQTRDCRGAPLSLKGIVNLLR